MRRARIDAGRTLTRQQEGKMQSTACLYFSLISAPFPFYLVGTVTHECVDLYRDWYRVSRISHDKSAARAVPS